LNKSFKRKEIDINTRLITFNYYKSQLDGYEKSLRRISKQNILTILVLNLFKLLFFDIDNIYIIVEIKNIQLTPKSKKIRYEN